MMTGKTYLDVFTRQENVIWVKNRKIGQTNENADKYQRETKDT